MYRISCELEVAGAHRLELDYKSDCQKLHGHNWKIKVFCESEKLNKNGMVIDYVKIKKYVNKLDHADLNKILDFNPTAENICAYLCNVIPFCYKVEIQEASKSWASYIK